MLVNYLFLKISNIFNIQINFWLNVNKNHLNVWILNFKLLKQNKKIYKKILFFLNLKIARHNLRNDLKYKIRDSVQNFFF